MGVENKKISKFAVVIAKVSRIDSRRMSFQV